MTAAVPGTIFLENFLAMFVVRLTSLTIFTSFYISLHAVLAFQNFNANLGVNTAP